LCVADGLSVMPTSLKRGSSCASGLSEMRQYGFD
jgi:hypothetical protein